MIRLCIFLFLGILFSISSCVSGHSPSESENVSESEHAPLSVLVSSGSQDIFDPNQSGQALFTLHHSFFCYPLRYSSQTGFVPDAVKSWSWSKDQKVLTLELDSDRRFHDGKEMSAVDLEFALVRPFLATKGNVAVDTNIRGSRHVKTGDRFRSGMIEGIRIVAPKSVTVSLEKPNPDFLYRLTSMSSQMTPIDSLEADYATFKGRPISCGDYRVAETGSGRERVKMEKFRDIPHALDSIELWNYTFDKLPKRPDLMIGGLFPGKKIDTSYYRTHLTKSQHTLFSFVLNDKAPLIHSQAFRKALDLALPRKDMSNTREESPTRDFVALGSPVHLGRPILLDLTEAKKLWLTLPAALREKDYKIYVKTNYPGPYFAMVESNLKAIGMKVQMVAKQMKNFDQAGENDILLGVGVIILNTGPIAMYQRFDERNPRHDPFPKFAQSELQKRIDHHQDTLDPKARLEAARDLAQFVLEQNLVLPMTYGYQSTVLSPRVKSYGGYYVSGIDLKELR